MIVERISAHHVRKVFQHRHFPRPPEGTDLSSLNLENRTRRCLMREGFDERPQTLGDHTIGEIMSMRAFGPRCLVDLLSALESLRQEAAGRLPDGRRSGVRAAIAAELTAAAARLADLPDAQAVRSDDPRFARAMSALDVEARTARELARRVLSRTQDPPDPVYLARQVEELADADRADVGTDDRGGVDRGLRPRSARPQRGNPHRAITVGATGGSIR